jgi:vacuolar-type H+-ATPase subunit H
VIRLDTLIKDIRETEAQADKVLADARSKAVQIVAKGKADASSLIATRKEEILADKQAALTERQKELEKEAQKQQKKAEKHAASIVGSAEGHRKEAMAFLVTSFKVCVDKE